MDTFVLATACKAPATIATALGFRTVRITFRWSTMRTPTPYSHWKEKLIGDCVWARGSSVASVESVWTMRGDHKPSPAAGQCCCQANGLGNLSLVSGSQPYRRVRRTTDSTETGKGRGNTARVSPWQPLSKRNSAQQSRRSHGSDTVDCAIDCSVGVGA
jgi:hypothetical protein